ncbi:hypothetical protein DFH08DRAFT_1074694 [Mycena albidolilacea]|uniref:Uncharacterized protein n=1 Tax=Mycena albidolilacea TaxID=1033008 RepID=A0AAD7F0H6_9AGAR|nr:hypothetical protein DFH08DRAFT_1074694 [Mycena albidolilacea]
MAQRWSSVEQSPRKALRQTTSGCSMNRNKFPSPLPQSDPGTLTPSEVGEHPRTDTGGSFHTRSSTMLLAKLSERPPSLILCMSEMGGAWLRRKIRDILSPDTRPKLKAFYDEMRTNAVFVFTWKSASADDIASATSNLDILEACRNTLGHPKILEKDPVWFLLGTKTVPDGYDYEFEDYKLPVMFAD